MLAPGRLLWSSHDSYPIPRCTAREASFRDFFGMLGPAGVQHGDNVIHLRIPFGGAAPSRETCLTYLRAVEAEIQAWSRLPYVRDLPFAAVHVRGLPAAVTAAELDRLAGQLRQRFRLAPQTSWTFDVDSGGPVTAELLGHLAGQGVDRVCFLIGTFERNLRETMRLGPSTSGVLGAVQRAAAAGIPHVGVEMIFGMPGQDLYALERDLTELVRRDFDSVTYRRLSSWPRPTELSKAMARYVRERLVQFGYHQVAASMFTTGPVPPDYYRMLHGGGYGEHRSQTLAIGAWAHGHLNGVSYLNAPGADAYARGWPARRPPVHLVSTPLADPRNRGAVFFPRFFRADRSLLPDDPATRSVIDRLRGRGDATDDGAVVSLTEQGKDRVSAISTELFESGQRVTVSWTGE